MTYEWPNNLFQSQGQYLHDMTEDQRTETVLQIARSLVGSRDTEQPMLTVCYTFDSPSHRQAMAKAQNKCSLTMAGIMRCAGISHELINGPYWGRTDAHSRLESLARASDSNGNGHAWLGHDAMPRRGLVLLIGTDVAHDTPGRRKILATWGSPGHACIVEKVDGEVVHTIDAGRGPVHRDKRTIVRIGEQVWIKDTAGLRTTRRVYGAIDVGQIRFYEDGAEWVLPIGASFPGYE
jgi:hypothetical protein